MIKHMISIAAAGAVITTGAMAFDTNLNGEIRSFPSNTISSINSGIAAETTAMTAQGSTGDALIYPLFMNDGKYSSEVVVRNSSTNAMVVKAVLYAGDDSQELLDFNIYLSGKDVCRFTIKDNKIYSEDGSLKIDGTRPIDITGGLTDYDKLEFASSTKPFEFDFSNSTVPLAKYKNGYIAIYGMVELSTKTSGDDTVLNGGADNGTTVAFHNDHKGIYAAYAKLLDLTRLNAAGNSGWRDITNKDVLKESVFINNSVVKSPHVELPNNVTWNTSATATNSATVTNVQNTSLSGEMRLINTEAKTDVLINAKAIQNFTPDAASPQNSLLWTEREYASIADRCLDTDGKYNTTCLTNDSNVFLVQNATYTYANKSNNGVVDNKMYVTQPYKRVLIQRFGDNTNNYSGTSTVVNTLRTGKNAYFTSNALVFDEDEQFPASTTTTTGLSLSGTANQSTLPNKYDSEVEIVGSDAFEQHPNNVAKFGDKDGFAEFNVGVPAIITQMVATKSGNAFVTNWIYSNTK